MSKAIEGSGRPAVKAAKRYLKRAITELNNALRRGSYYTNEQKAKTDLQRAWNIMELAKVQLEWAFSQQSINVSKPKLSLKKGTYND